MIFLLFYIYAMSIFQTDTIIFLSNVYSLLRNNHAFKDCVYTSYRQHIYISFDI